MVVCSSKKVMNDDYGTRAFQESGRLYPAML